MDRNEDTQLARLNEMCRLTEAALADRLARPGSGIPPQLSAAARHVLLAPAKRARALLTLAAVEDLGGNIDLARCGACALEFVHSASLILDDLPCMDDAQGRRNRETVHRAYGEATAILAAIGLIAEAYRSIADEHRLPVAARTRMSGELAQAMGFDGLTSGQFEDLYHLGGDVGIDRLEQVYRRKTGALFGLALSFGGTVSAANCETVDKLREAGLRIGLAFQIFDDLLDGYSSSAAIGKDVGKDDMKANAVSVIGAAAAAVAARSEIAAARQQLVAILGIGCVTRLLDGLVEQTLQRISLDELESADTRSSAANVSGSGS